MQGRFYLDAEDTPYWEVSRFLGLVKKAAHVVKISLDEGDTRRQCGQLLGGARGGVASDGEDLEVALLGE
jgi:hypothetical protein